MANSRAYIILGGNFKSFRLFLRHLEPPKNKIYGTSWYNYHVLFSEKKEKNSKTFGYYTFMRAINILEIAFFQRLTNARPFFSDFIFLYSSQNAIIITLWLFCEWFDHKMIKVGTRYHKSSQISRFLFSKSFTTYSIELNIPCCLRHTYDCKTITEMCLCVRCRLTFAMPICKFISDISYHLAKKLTFYRVVEVRDTFFCIG